jgi:hypothetical protein
VVRQLVLARAIEPVSKLDSIRVLEEVGVASASYCTIEAGGLSFILDMNIPDVPCQVDK